MEETDYVLMKRGAYYRPDARGYTDSLVHAGIFTRKQAEAHCNAADGVTMMPLCSFLSKIDEERKGITRRLKALDNIERRALGLTYEAA